MLDGRPIELMPVLVGPPSLIGEAFTEFAAKRPANDFDWDNVVGTELTVVPDIWHLNLTDGHELRVYANDVNERDGENVFTLSVKEDKPSLPVVRMSSALIASIRRERIPPAL